MGQTYYKVDDNPSEPTSPLDTLAYWDMCEAYQRQDIFEPEEN